MIIGIFATLIVLIICLCIIACIYLYYCGENEVGIFGICRYRQRIFNLEKEVEELKKRE